MARARNIKPSFFSNEDLVELEPIVRLLFIGLWTLADRKGRLEDRPKKIKMELFPCDDFNIDESLDKLCKYNFLNRYSVGGNSYIQIVNFEKHQSPHKTEKNSVIPDACDKKRQLYNESITVNSPLNNGEPIVTLPPDSLIPDSLIPDSLNDDLLNHETINKNIISPVSEKKISKRGSRISEDWKLDGELLDWTKQEYPVADSVLIAIAQGFKDYWLAKAGKDGVKLDWAATWRNWCRNSYELKNAKPLLSTQKNYEGGVWDVVD